MGIIDYRREPRSDIAFIDMKSFYASVECVDRGLDPLTTSLCVMSRSDHASGVILASSPTFKKVFHKKNVSRSYDLPFDLRTRRFNFYKAKQEGWPRDPDFVHYIESWARRTLMVPPRMGRYIEVNMAIQDILTQYAPREEILPYSIDEGFIDLTRSLSYLLGRPSQDRRQDLDKVADQIQRQIWRETGIYSTIGLSNANPLLAKLALDNEAKHRPSMRANWSYEDVESKVWSIPQLTDFWGIGHRTARRLNKLGIHSIKDLANSHPDRLKEEFGVMGLQLFFHANGVDESDVRFPYRPQSKGLGNSQILPRDYYRQEDVELVLSEMAAQVAVRLRRAQKKATTVSIYVGYSREVELPPLKGQMTIDPSHNTRQLTQAVLYLFRKKYQAGPVRQVAVRYGGFVDPNISLISLFEDPDQVARAERLEATIDQVRDRFGFLSLQPASVLKENSRTITRSKLIGGHSAGGLDGLA